MTSPWQIEKELKVFDELCKSDQDAIISEFFEEEKAEYYGYPALLMSLLVHINDESTVLRLLNFFIESKAVGQISDIHYMIIKRMCKIVGDADKIKNVLKTPKYKKLHRTFLILDDISLEEEELGLRSLSTIKYPTWILYIRRYIPRKETLQRLPTVARLNAIESLLSYDNIAYNIFADIKTEEEFNELMFSALTKYPDRVMELSRKYKEVSNFGKDSVVTVKCKCDNCGTYEITLNSTRMGSEDGFINTGLGRFVLLHKCTLCDRADTNYSVEKFDIEV